MNPDPQIQVEGCRIELAGPQPGLEKPVCRVELSVNESQMIDPALAVCIERQPYIGNLFYVSHWQYCKIQEFYYRMEASRQKYSSIQQ